MASVPTLPKRAPLQATHLKDLLVVFKKEYYHFSPAIGGSLTWGDYLKTFQKLSDEKNPSPTIELAIQLFNAPTELDVIRPTNSKSKVAAWLTLEELGAIVGLLETHVEPEQNLRWEKLAEAICTRSGGEKSGCTKSKIRKFFQLCFNAMKESRKTANRRRRQHLLLPGMAVLLFAAIVWLSAENKQGLINYISGIASVIPMLQFLDVPRILTTNSQEQKLFCTSEFSSALLVSPTLEGQWRSLVATNSPNLGAVCEELLASYRLAPQQSYPPLINYKSTRAVGSDCMETGIRQVMNLIFFNASTQLFDFTILKPGTFIHEDLAKFYRSHTPKDAGALTTHNAWADLLVKISGLSRGSGRDLRPGSDNFVKVFNYFLHTGATSMENLAALLSHSKLTVVFRSVPLKRSQWEIHVTLYPNDLNRRQIIGYITFGDSHCTWTDGTTRKPPCWSTAQLAELFLKDPPSWKANENCLMQAALLHSWVVMQKIFKLSVLPGCVLPTRLKAWAIAHLMTSTEDSRVGTQICSLTNLVTPALLSFITRFTLSQANKARP